MMNPRHRRYSSDISECNCCLMKAKISIQLYTYLTHTHTHATFLYTRARVYRKVIIYNLLWICYFLSAIILWYSVCKIVAPYDVNSGTVIWHHVVWTVRRSYDLRSYQNHIGELAKKKKSQRAQLEQT